ncbi:hypothetical protein K438DRAFT_1751992 [Mycena galopus ATCC 62051]|nr:hypothetical protein K438DRAFT_1751992 [Mycena galopus ATCC 62051]
MSTSQQHTFLGMGAMGRGMAANLALKGGLTKPVLIWNRTHKTAVDTAERIGSRAQAVEDIIAAVSGSDVVWSCLYDHDAVEKVFHELIEQVDLAGKLVVECSTVSVEAGNDLGQRILAAGGRFVAMPVFGYPTMAADGQLSCITAGPAADVLAIKPFLVGVMGKAHIDLSDQEPSKAQELKLCGNILNFTALQQLAEFYTMVDKAGIGAKRGHQLVQALFPPETPHYIYGEGMVSGRCFDTQNIVVDVQKALHIVGYVNELAQRNGVPLKAYNLTAENFRAIEGRGDYMSVYGVVREQIRGTKFGGKKTAMLELCIGAASLSLTPPPLQEFYLESISTVRETREFQRAPPTSIALEWRAVPAVALAVDLASVGILIATLIIHANLRHNWYIILMLVLMSLASIGAALASWRWWRVHKIQRQASIPFYRVPPPVVPAR